MACLAGQLRESCIWGWIGVGVSEAWAPEVSGGGRQTFGRTRPCSAPAARLGSVELGDTSARRDVAGGTVVPPNPNSAGPMSAKFGATTASGHGPGVGRGICPQCDPWYIRNTGESSVCIRVGLSPILRKTSLEGNRQRPRPHPLSIHTSDPGRNRPTPSLSVPDRVGHGAHPRADSVARRGGEAALANAPMRIWGGQAALGATRW